MSAPSPDQPLAVTLAKVRNLTTYDGTLMYVGKGLLVFDGAVVELFPEGHPACRWHVRMLKGGEVSEKRGKQRFVLRNPAGTKAFEALLESPGEVAEAQRLVEAIDAGVAANRRVR